MLCCASPPTLLSNAGLCLLSFACCRFVTANSVETDILERAKRKMVLDHLVIQVNRGVIVIQLCFVVAAAFVSWCPKLVVC